MVGKEGILIFDSEDETSYLMDRAIYDIKIEGKWFVEVYIERHSKDESLTNNEKRLLQAKGRGIPLGDTQSSLAKLNYYLSTFHLTILK